MVSELLSGLSSRLSSSSRFFIEAKIHRFFHLRESTVVETACLVDKKEIMWRRTSSGKSVIMSSSFFAFFIRCGLEYVWVVGLLRSIIKFDIYYTVGRFCVEDIGIRV